MKKLMVFIFCILMITAASLSIAEAVDNAAASLKSLPSDTVITAQPSLPNKSSTRLWNLQDADILSVINEVSQETGKNFVIDPRVSGKITLISSKAIRSREVYQVFLSILGMLGYAAIPSGNVIKIVPSMESGEHGAKVVTNSLPGKGDEIVVRVIPLTNVSATQMIPVVRPMMPQWSNVSSYSPGNILILLGRAANLEKIAEVIYDIDKTANSNIQIIPLRHASAVQVNTVLNNLQNASRASGDMPTVSIAVDERSNSILLSGPKNQRLRIRVLISQLDQPASNSGNTEVVYLKYLQAKEFAPLLGRIAQNMQGKASSGGSYEGVTSSISSISGMNSNKSASSSSKEAAPNQSNIQAEVNTNSLIITAPPALMQALKSVVSKLDIRPAEVLVEAIIAEIDESNLTALGIQWGSVTNGEDSTKTANGSSPTSFPPLGAGVFGIMPQVQIAAVLSLLRNQNGVDIISTPHIMVLDNQEATIEIGKDVPYQTGSYSTSGNATTATPFTTNQYKPVTLKLTVTPQINLGRSVRLKLNLKNDTLQNPQNPGITPIINTSKIKNSVLVNNDDVLVIGGLKQKSNNENINKVPYLSALPFIGPLFQQKVTNVENKNLVVFLKPLIVQNVEESNIISYSKYNEVRIAKGNFRDDLAEIGDRPINTTLPPWRNARDLPKPFECGDSC